MKNVTDVRGVQWMVRRRWWYDTTNTGDVFDGSDGFAGLLLSPALLAAFWPCWFLAHWLGLPWRIAVSERGVLVDEQEVRGWRESRARIQAIADQISAGTLVA